MPHFKKCIYVDDLLAVTFFSCLGAVFILIPPFNETFLKIPLSLSLFFFIPGYAFISALFPGNKEIRGIERFTLSVGFSLILTVFDGFLISLLPWGYRPAPIILSILGITAFFSIIALFVRKLLDESEQFSFSIKKFIKDLKSDDPEEKTMSDINKLAEVKPIPVEKRHFHRSRSKVRAKGLKYQPEPEVKKKSLPPEIEKALIIALIGSIIIASGMLVYAKMTREKETFTMLYLLGPDGKAEGYPTESLINVPLNVSVGIENHELEDVNYVLQMRADGEVIEELNISLKDRETWQKNMTYIRQKLKTGRSKLEFALFKDNPYNFPYRSVHLYLENNNNLAYVDKHNYTEVPVIENGDMESSTGWNFTSNTDKVTGSYVNGSGVESSYAYRIINSNTKNPFGLPEYGEISQDVKCKGNTMVLLSAFVKGDSNSSRGADNQIKQITVNGETVWTDRISRDEVWKHIEVPISLQAGSNNLVFGLTQISGKIYPVEVLWDNIALKPLTEISNVSENGTVKTTSQNLSVVKPPVTRPAEVKLDITPNPCKNATNFTVACSIPLQVAVCLVTPDGFEPDSIELKSTDGVIWTGSYVIKHGKHFYVEALCTDTYGNTTSTFDEITVDKSLPDFLIEINPKTIDSGDLEIKVTPSNALKKQPSVSIFANKTVNITYMSYSDGTYLYKAKIDSETNEGEHKISVTGYDPDSKKVQDNTTFIIDHPG